MAEDEVARLGYQQQESQLTLREGLDEYFAANPGLLDASATSSRALGTYLANHDVSHVVFGTSTSLRGEMLQDTWTFLAIDVSAVRYVREFVREEEGRQVMKEAIRPNALPGMLWLLGQLPRLLRVSRRMERKWLWEGWEPYLDEPLGKIRSEFGIRVVQA